MDLSTQNVGDWGLLLSAVSAVCAWAATLMPAPSDNSGVIYRTFYKNVNWAGANLGKATNADDAAKKKA